MATFSPGFENARDRRTLRWLSAAPGPGGDGEVPASAGGLPPVALLPADRGPTASSYPAGMPPEGPAGTQVDPSRIPPAVRELASRLEERGERAWLVGGSVRDLALGRTPRDFDLATTASPERVLACFPRAVPIGLRFGTVMVPLPPPVGPVDVTTLRAGPRIEDDLARRDFTLNALALDLRTGRVIDPAGGLRDLRKGRLRAVGSARERLAEDPLRSLRAARFLATLELEPDPELVRAMEQTAGALRGVAPERLRDELLRLLGGPRAGRGLELLHRTGIAAMLAPGARAEAAAGIDAFPRDLPLRLAAWLGRPAAPAALRRLRLPRSLVRAVERILAIRLPNRVRDPDALLRRLVRRSGEEAVAGALALRVAGLDPDGRRVEPEVRTAARRLLERLAELRAAGTLHLRREELALSGRDVMEILGLPPGPEVGLALEHLLRVVLAEPASNRPDVLRQELVAWWRNRKREPIIEGS